MDVVYILASDSEGENSSDIVVGEEIKFANVEGLTDMRMERPRSHANEVSRFGGNTAAGSRDYCLLRNKRPEPDQAFRAAFRTLVLVAVLVVPRKQCSIGRLALMDLLRKNFGKFPIVTDQKLSDGIDWNLANGTMAVVLRCMSGNCSNDRYRCEQHPSPTVANAADCMRNVGETAQSKAIVVRRAVQAVAAVLQEENGPLDVYDVVAYLTEVNPNFNIDWDDMDICLDGMMEEGLITGELLDGYTRLIQLREDVDMPDASSELLVQSFDVIAQHYERHGWKRWFGPDNAPPPANKSRWLASSVPASSLTCSLSTAQQQGRPQITATAVTSRHPVPHAAKPMPSPAVPSTLPVYMDRSPASHGPGPSVPALARISTLHGQAATAAGNPQPTFSVLRGQQPLPFLGGLQSAVLDPAAHGPGPSVPVLAGIGSLHGQAATAAVNLQPTFSFLRGQQPLPFLGGLQSAVLEPGLHIPASFLGLPQPPVGDYGRVSNSPFLGELPVPVHGPMARSPFLGAPQPPMGDPGALQYLASLQESGTVAPPSGQGQGQGRPAGAQRLAQPLVSRVGHAKPPTGGMGREAGPSGRMQPGASSSHAYQGQNSRTPLHHEIITFAEQTTSAPGGAQAARQACDRLREIVRSIWPHADMHLFGSQATGLALPGSDLDVVVLGVTPVLRNAAQGFTSQEKQVVTAHLNALLRRMRSSGLVERSFLIGRAKVPIIKAQIRGPGNLQVDVSMGVMNGVTAVGFISRQISSMPPLRALVLVLKALLRDAGMNEVHTGGLSSYSTTLMVMAYLMQEGYPLARGNHVDPHALPNGATQDLGHLLIGFLDRFVRRFNYANEAVSVDHGGFRMKPAIWKDFSAKREALAIEDPQEPGRNIAGGSHRIADVRDLFKASLECLEDGLANYSQNGGRNGSAAEAWARIQEDGASRSVVQPQMPLLGKLFSIQEALSPSGSKPLQESGPSSSGAPMRKEKRAKMVSPASTSTKKKKRKGPRLPRPLEVAGAPLDSPVPKRRRY